MVTELTITQLYIFTMMTVIVFGLWIFHPQWWLVWYGINLTPLKIWLGFEVMLNELIWQLWQSNGVST